MPRPLDSSRGERIDERRCVAQIDISVYIQICIGHSSGIASEGCLAHARTREARNECVPVLTSHDTVEVEVGRT